VFVVTHTKRVPWERPGGTIFHFVNVGIESALAQGREAAGDRDVRIAGGAETIQEYLNTGLVDEFSVTLVVEGLVVRRLAQPLLGVPSGSLFTGRACGAG
ncbi:MAG: dihydrofolate reductase family protein, partial [Chloroflexi bacterium]|nr:dihydrofolate reductase family protein [Chloroflexota bacterium]